MTTRRDHGVAKAHRTVSRVTRILEVVAGASSGVKLSALVAELDAAKSSVHGLAKGLVATGYLREENGLYRLGPAVTYLLGVDGAGLEITARPVMEELQQRFDETVMLATQVGDSVIYVDAVESTQPIRYSPPLRKRRPMWPTSTGKCFLAYFSERRRALYLREHLSEAERAHAAGELERVRENRYALNRGETLPDISAVGCPILKGERAVACLAVVGPTSRMGDRLETMAPIVRDASQRLWTPS